MSLYNLHYLEFLATSHDKFWSHPAAKQGIGRTVRTHRRGTLRARERLRMRTSFVRFRAVPNLPNRLCPARFPILFSLF